MIGCVGEPKHHTLLHDVALNENSGAEHTPDTCSVDNACRQAPHTVYNSSKRKISLVT